MTSYEEKIIWELRTWQAHMQRPPTLVNRLAGRLQHKLNRLIPEKAHRIITSTIKQMIRGVLFGSRIISPKPPLPLSLALQEDQVLTRIGYYKKVAAAEGGLTGAGGFLWGLADFPLLLSLKLKMLFDIATLYGYAVDDYRERLYLLYIFQLAFSSPQQRRRIYAQMVDWETRKQHLPADIHQFDWRTFQQEYRDYIDLAKMAQLIPIIGAPVGAVVNYRLLHKLGTTAMNAYRMRWLEQQILNKSRNNKT